MKNKISLGELETIISTQKLTKRSST